jgi:hypothetical protein
MAEEAPLSLNDPVSWRHSALNIISAFKTLLMLMLERVGVW